jgi:hypothetical protein
MLNKDEVWKRILDYARSSYEKPIPLLNPNKKSPFIITEISDYHIRIDKLPIKMTKQMFLRIYDYIKSKSDWVKIGASRTNTEEETIEGFIKKEFFGNNPNGLSTATWFSAILVYSDIGVEFNNKAKGQKLR